VVAVTRWAKPPSVRCEEQQSRVVGQQRPPQPLKLRPSAHAKRVSRARRPPPSAQFRLFFISSCWLQGRCAASVVAPASVAVQTSAQKERYTVFFTPLKAVGGGRTSGRPPSAAVRARQTLPVQR